ncbi:MAG TPA: lysophospholipid acyltransferase family protein [Burkholderiaceae bacterium]|nr:lysophospholipid acyltransferase family protein [Burkholderiaceae bacterium]
MLIAVFRALSALPLSWLHAAGALLGLLAPHLSAGYRQRFDDGFAHSGLADPARRRAALREAGKTIFELPWIWMRPPATTQAKVRVTGWDVVERARAQQRGIVFLTPHQGCFEITAQTYAYRGGPLTVLFSPPKRAAARDLLDVARARPNLQAAPATLSGVRQLVRALKRGEAVGILPDQVPGPNEGAWADFFHRPAYTMTLPVKLQQLSNAVMVLAVGERLPRSAGYVVHFFEWNEPWAATPEAQARQINAAVENLVQRFPEQYLWAYNRYKRPAGVPPPSSTSV